MRSFCQLAVLALPLFSTAVAASPNDQADHPKTIYASAQEAFHDLLSALPDESLQAALSGLKDFKNGVFESHHQGVEHIHSEDPALATKLIVDAINELKKRQAPSGNGTTTVTEAVSAPQTSENAPSTPTSQAAPPAETTVTQTQQQTTVTQVQTQTQQQTQTQTRTQQQTQTQTRTQQQTQTQTQQTEQTQQTQQTNDATTVNPPPATVTNTQQQTTTQAATTTIRQTTTQQRPAIIPVEATVTEDGTTLVRTTRVLSEVTASVPVTRTLTNAQGATVTQTENRPAVIRTTTDSAGRTTITTSAANYAPTAGEVQTETDKGGSTFLTTFTPGGALVSSIKLITTTDAEGRPSTMTSYTFVDPIQATSTDSGGGESTESPTVQSGAAVVNAVPYAAVGLGAFAFFFFF